MASFCLNLLTRWLAFSAAAWLAWACCSISHSLCCCSSWSLLCPDLDSLLCEAFLDAFLDLHCAGFWMHLDLPISCSLIVKASCTGSGFCVIGSQQGGRKIPGTCPRAGGGGT